MKRIFDETFKFGIYNPDRIVAIRIKNGEMYFLAWMEDAQNYKVQKAVYPESCVIDIGNLMLTGDLKKCIMETDGYNKMYNLYTTDDAELSMYEYFLSLVSCYKSQNGTSDEEDHDIFVVTKTELSQICDVLRDGEYIIILSDGTN